MAKNNNLGDLLTSIADAIRTKKGTSDAINAQDFDTEIANLPRGGSGEWTRPSAWCDCDAVYTQYGNRKNCLVLGFDNSGVSANNKVSVKIAGSAYNVMLHNASGVAQWTEPRTFAANATSEIELDSSMQYGCLVYYTNGENNNIVSASYVANGTQFESSDNCVVEIVGHQYAFTNGLRGYLLTREKRNVDTCAATGLMTAWYNCVGLESLDVSGWDTSNWSITSLFSTWNGCASLRNLDLSGWDTSNWSITSLQSVFTGCASLRNLNVSGWDTSNWSVATMYMTWSNCNSLRNLDLSGWDTSNWSVTNATSSWNACYSLLSIVVTSFKPFMQVNCDISATTRLTRQSMINIFNALIPATTTRTLKLGTTNLNKLSAEDKAIATNKGYTLS